MTGVKKRVRSLRPARLQAETSSSRKYKLGRRNWGAHVAPQFSCVLLAGATEDCGTVLATGRALTVYLCHPFVVHAAQPHHGREPRFMAQPPLVPSTDFDPTAEPSPVQIAILKARDLTI